MIKKLIILLLLLPLSISVHTANVGICLGPKECTLVIDGPNQETEAPSSVPLIIYFPASGSPIVGYDETLPYLKKDPANCFSNIMELLEQSGKIQREVTIRGKKYSTQDLLHIIFQNIRNRITLSMNEPVVIAIPTNLSYNQREIVRGAAFDAGLRPIRLVNATTAAAIQYIRNSISTAESKGSPALMGGKFRVADALHKTISTFKFEDAVLHEKKHEYHVTIDPKANFDAVIFRTQDKSHTESCHNIALGAAAYAAMIDKEVVNCKGVCLVTAVMPYALHLKTPKGTTRTIIAQNKPYPYTAPIIDYNVTQNDADLLIYQDKNESDIIGNLVMHGIKGKAHIIFEIDRNGVLHAHDTYKTNKNEEIQATSKGSRIFSQYSGGTKALSLETERWKCLEYIKSTEDAYYANKELQKRLWFWQRGVIRFFGFSAFRSLAESAKSVEEIKALNDKVLEMRLALGLRAE